MLVLVGSSLYASSATWARRTLIDQVVAVEAVRDQLFGGRRR